MGRSNTSVRVAAERAVDQVASRRTAVLNALDQVTRSSAFRASGRSQEFLRYIVETALDRNFESLKERVIGSALFGRAPDYDTGSDAIVRVVANETRRRLGEYYAGEGQTDKIHIGVPSGSYIPAIDITAEDVQGARSALADARAGPLGDTQQRSRLGWLRIAWPVTVVAVTFLCLFLWIQNRELGRRLDAEAVTQRAIPRSLLWPQFFSGSRSIHVVLADASAGGVQVLLKHRMPLSDYLDGRVYPDAHLNPETALFVQFLMRSQFTTASYAMVAVKLAQLADSFSHPLSVIYARELTLRTFQGGDHFIVLGTARANPWAQLFEDRLNFNLHYDAHSDLPVFLNRAPRPGEPSRYAPDGTGSAKQSYGQVAFLPNLHRDGHVLLITGIDSQGTEAAGEFVTDLARLDEAMTRMGIVRSSLPRAFEILLRVTHTGKAPIGCDIVASRVSPPIEQ